MNFPTVEIPIVKIPHPRIQLFIKREDLVHPDVSGNKYWKLFYNIKNYLSTVPENPLLITFGGAFSNHIAAVAALGRDMAIPTIGIIRGEELEDKISDNVTLKKAAEDGMEFIFVSREAYRTKSALSAKFAQEYPEGLIIPEGGSNHLAVMGIQHILTEDTKDFNYICAAVGTGGTIAGLSKFAQPDQKVLGFKVVNDPNLKNQIIALGAKENFELFEAHEGAYGKITDETVRFINNFYSKYAIPLDPVYTGKMVRHLFMLAEKGYFAEDEKVLAIHTGGLQGILGANQLLKKKKRNPIDFGA